MGDASPSVTAKDSMYSHSKFFLNMDDYGTSTRPVSAAWMKPQRAMPHRGYPMTANMNMNLNVNMSPGPSPTDSTTSYTATATTSAAIGAFQEKSFLLDRPGPSRFNN